MLKVCKLVFVANDQSSNTREYIHSDVGISALSMALKFEIAASLPRYVRGLDMFENPKVKNTQPWPDAMRQKIQYPGSLEPMVPRRNESSAFTDVASSAVAVRVPHSIFSRECDA